MSKMTHEQFAKEYGDVIVAYQKLQMLLGEEKAKELLDKMLERPYVGQ